MKESPGSRVIADIAVIEEQTRLFPSAERSGKGFGTSSEPGLRGELPVASAEE